MYLIASRSLMLGDIVQTTVLTAERDFDNLSFGLSQAQRSSTSRGREACTWAAFPATGRKS
jgi:hypothetical protein